MPATETVNGEVIRNWEIVEGSYKNNVNKGTATVIIRGLGNYGGMAKVTFKIGARKFLW